MRVDGVIHFANQASFIVTVATLAAVCSRLRRRRRYHAMCRPIHDAGPAHPPGSYADVSRVLPRPPMSLLPPAAELCSGPSSPPSLCRCIAVGSSFLSTVIWGWGRHRCSLSLSLSWGQLQAAVSGRRPLGFPAPPLELR